VVARRCPARALLFVLALAALLGVCAERPLRAAEEYNFAGSAQLDYHLVPNGPRVDTASGQGTPFQGFTMEAGLKVAVDISEHLSANVKACYGCHGLELDMAYFDYRAVDELNLRVGRFSPSFGAFNLRHDPANHMLSDKPSCRLRFRPTASSSTAPTGSARSRNSTMPCMQSLASRTPATRIRRT
jgi:hypothetical protein